MGESPGCGCVGGLHGQPHLPADWGGGCQQNSARTGPSVQTILVLRMFWFCWNLSSGNVEDGRGRISQVESNRVVSSAPC